LKKKKIKIKNNYYYYRITINMLEKNFLNKIVFHEFSCKLIGIKRKFPQRVKLLNLYITFIITI